MVQVARQAERVAPSLDELLQSRRALLRITDDRYTGACSETGKAGP